MLLNGVLNYVRRGGLVTKQKGGEEMKCTDCKQQNYLTRRQQCNTCLIKKLETTVTALCNQVIELDGRIDRLVKWQRDRDSACDSVLSG